MKIIRNKNRYNHLVISPRINKYKVWLALGILVVILILGVVLFYIVRPEVLFGKGIGSIVGGASNGESCDTNYECSSDDCDENLGHCMRCDKDSDCTDNRACPVGDEGEACRRTKFKLCVAGVEGATSRRERSCVEGVRCDTYRDCRAGEGCAWDISQSGNYNPYCKPLSSGRVGCTSDRQYSNCPPTHYCTLDRGFYDITQGYCQPRKELGQSCTNNQQCLSYYCNQRICQTSSLNCPLQNVYWSLEQADDHPITEAYVGQRVYLNAEFPASSSCDLTKVSFKVIRVSRLTDRVVFRPLSPVDSTSVVGSYTFIGNDLADTLDSAFIGVDILYKNQDGVKELLPNFVSDTTIDVSRYRNIGNPCGIDDQCKSGLRCMDQICNRELGFNPLCSIAHPCPAGLDCVNGLCTNRDEELNIVLEGAAVSRLINSFSCPSGKINITSDRILPDGTRFAAATYPRSFCCDTGRGYNCADNGCYFAGEFPRWGTYDSSYLICRAQDNNWIQCNINSVNTEVAGKKCKLDLNNKFHWVDGSLPDVDNDGVLDIRDNCRDTPNLDQRDSDVGRFIMKLNSSFSTPIGVAVDDEDNVYVLDLFHNGRITKFNPWGDLITTWDTNTNKPKAIAVDHNKVYVTDSQTNRLTTFDLNGNSNELSYGGFNYPLGVAVHKNGKAYIVNNQIHLVKRYNPTGNLINQWGSLGSANGQFNSPSGIAIDDSGMVYVVDSGNNRIQIFNGSGDYQNVWGSSGNSNGQFNAPYGIALRSIWDIYITDSGNNRIQKFEGHLFQAKWGSSGPEDGKFNNPQGIAVDSHNNVYVADSGNNRVQKFSGGDRVGDVCDTCTPNKEICNNIDDDCNGEVDKSDSLFEFVNPVCNTFERCGDYNTRCNLGEICSTGNCIRDIGASCTSNDDCSFGIVCTNQVCSRTICPNGAVDNEMGCMCGSALIPWGNYCCNGVLSTSACETVASGDITRDRQTTDADVQTLQFIILASADGTCGASDQNSCHYGDTYACDDGRYDFISFSCDTNNPINGDVNGDGQITDTDVLVLQFMILASADGTCGASGQNSCPYGDSFACDDGRYDFDSFIC